MSMVENELELKKMFGGHWGEHPQVPVQRWVDEVVTGATRLGYWEYALTAAEAETLKLEESTRIGIELLEGGKMPERKHADDAAFDCCTRHAGCIEPGETKKVPLGFKVELPVGWEMQVRSRSGLAAEGVQIANSPGTVDAGYRGEVCALVYNSGREAFKYIEGTRICQVVFQQLPKVALGLIEKVGETERGAKGFGSTGVN